jgi:hypothetical protein
MILFQPVNVKPSKDCGNRFCPFFFFNLLGSKVRLEALSRPYMQTCVGESHGRLLVHTTTRSMRQTIASN